MKSRQVAEFLDLLKTFFTEQNRAVTLAGDRLSNILKQKHKPGKLNRKEPDFECEPDLFGQRSVLALLDQTHQSGTSMLETIPLFTESLCHDL
jgi:hypothetical protein